MSIESEICAEYAEKVRKKWVSKLSSAYTMKDWGAVRILLKEMNEFYFSE